MSTGGVKWFGGKRESFTNYQISGRLIVGRTDRSMEKNSQNGENDGQ